jgi:hypothetical protein
VRNPPVTITGILATARTLAEVGLSLRILLALAVDAFVPDGHVGHLRLLQRAAGEFEEIDVGIVEPAYELDALGVGERAYLEVGRVELDSYGKLGAHRGSNGTKNFEEETGAIRQRATPLVATTVRKGAEELREQVPVCRV